MKDYSTLRQHPPEEEDAYNRWLDTFSIYYGPEECAQLIEIRNRVFLRHRRLSYPFRFESWVRVIIRGSLEGSDRSEPPRNLAPGDEEAVDEWKNDDPRDELDPLLQILYEDGVEEIIHACDSIDDKRAVFVGSPVNIGGLRCYLPGNYLSGRLGPVYRDHPFLFIQDTERVIFDRTGRWGMFASCEEFGLLGGDPEFMARYLEKAGGIGFIREKADKYWQLVVDFDGYEADYVENYYKLAGWENPPRRREN